MGSSLWYAGAGWADLQASMYGEGQGSARSRGCQHQGCPPHVCAMGVPKDVFHVLSSRDLLST